jgi:hypothetical protein
VSKRKDLQEIWFQWQQTGASGEALEAAWELGRIAGLRQAARICQRTDDFPDVAIRAEARRLKRRLKT